MIMKRIVKFLLIATLALGMSSCGSCSSNSNEEETLMEVNELKTERMFDIETNLGTMRIKLYDKTPLHRDNFAKLVAKKYYDSTLFHRVIPGFMIQAGDPLTRDTSMVDKWGTGGPGYTVPAEFVNEYWHKKGVVAAARQGDLANPKKSSSGSQFYIVHDENACLHLDGEYTIFGETIDGFDVIDKIASVETDLRDLPINPVIIISIKEFIPEPEVKADSVKVDSVKNE